LMYCLVTRGFLHDSPATPPHLRNRTSAMSGNPAPRRVGSGRSDYAASLWCAHDAM
jgi:hypothetical protein